jgi:hypothetical protein
MKHVMYGDKAVFLDDELAEAVLDYARALGESGHADVVTVPAVTADGNLVETSFLLNAASTLVAESADTHFDVPSDDRLALDIRARADALGTSVGGPAEMSEPAAGDDFDI